MRYRRAFAPGGSFFFTQITAGRQPILATDETVDLLREAIRRVKVSRPFKIDAMVILPDHIHCIWTLPVGDTDFSTRWRLIKTWFTKHCDPVLREDLREQPVVWQNRFWEHLLRDEQDFSRHVDYIHYNPVKHGLVKHVVDWPFSSFHRFVEAGHYAADWGTGALDFSCIGRE